MKRLERVWHLKMIVRRCAFTKSKSLLIRG